MKIIKNILHIVVLSGFILACSQNKVSIPISKIMNDDLSVSFITKSLDRDFDGIPDVVEQAYGLDARVANIPDIRLLEVGNSSLKLFDTEQLIWKSKKWRNRKTKILDNFFYNILKDRNIKFNANLMSSYSIMTNISYFEASKIKQIIDGELKDRRNLSNQLNLSFNLKLKALKFKGLKKISNIKIALKLYSPVTKLSKIISVKSLSLNELNFFGLNKNINEINRDVDINFSGFSASYLRFVVKNNLQFVVSIIDFDYVLLDKKINYIKQRKIIDSHTAKIILSNGKKIKIINTTKFNLKKVFDFSKKKIGILPILDFHVNFSRYDINKFDVSKLRDKSWLAYPKDSLPQTLLTTGGVYIFHYSQLQNILMAKRDIVKQLNTTKVVDKNTTLMLNNIELGDVYRIKMQITQEHFKAANYLEKRLGIEDSKHKQCIGIFAYNVNKEIVMPKQELLYDNISQYFYAFLKGDNSNYSFSFTADKNLLLERNNVEFFIQINPNYYMQNHSFELIIKSNQLIQEVVRLGLLKIDNCDVNNSNFSECREELCNTLSKKYKINSILKISITQFR